MQFNFRNLDNETRRFMVEEIEAATADQNLYFNKRFTPEANATWATLLLEAARDQNEHWLAYQLEMRDLMKGFEGSRTPSGGYTTKYVPHTAAEIIAGGQFNRYYILAVCRRAIAENTTQVFVYRAKEVDAPRPASEAMVGNSVNPSELIEQIRPLQSSLGHELLKPNSGLSIHLAVAELGGGDQGSCG